jgi:HD-GYP domain-containing protein (c-di-GMP phosphodiesterase class II)
VLPAQQRLNLRLLGEARHRNIWESHQRLRIGRLDHLEVAIADNSLSRHHAELAPTERGWVLRDLGSTNGTFLNGERVRHYERLVRDGDVIQVGEVFLQAALLNPEPPGSDLPAGVEVAGDALHDWSDLPRLAAAWESAGDMVRPVALLRIGRGAASGRTLETHIEIVLWEVAEALQASRASVWIQDAATGTLDPQAAFGATVEEVRRDGGAVRCAGAAVGRQRSLALRAAGADGPAALCCLLRTDGQPFGALHLERPADEPFAPADLDFADALALAASGGIENARAWSVRHQESFLHSVAALAQLITLRDESAERHARRVTDYALLLADELKLPARDRFLIQVGAPVHDLGLMAVSDALLAKPGPLTADEARRLRVGIGRAVGILETCPALVALVPIVRSHHERWDGAGYPDGLAGESIPVLGRVVAVAEAFDAMTSDRPYRRALTPDEAFGEIARLAGAQFDPRCAGAWQRLKPQVLKIFRERGLGTRTLSPQALAELREFIAERDTAAARG